MTDTFYEPMNEELDLSHDEKLRTTAIMMAIRYYGETIIKTGDLYKALVKNNASIVPAHEDRVLEIAMKFGHYIKSGHVMEFEVKEQEEGTNDQTDRPTDDEAGSAALPVEPD